MFVRQLYELHGYRKFPPLESSLSVLHNIRKKSSSENSATLVPLQDIMGGSTEAVSLLLCSCLVGQMVRSGYLLNSWLVDFPYLNKTLQGQEALRYHTFLRILKLRYYSYFTLPKSNVIMLHIFTYSTFLLILETQKKFCLLTNSHCVLIRTRNPHLLSNVQYCTCYKFTLSGKIFLVLKILYYYHFQSKHLAKIVL